ncbi:LEAF RUST 10 DISEASE-RESISTANCE LOCUS RECEPTOR-LIKE PROTEIN KINASE-like 2.1 isoform X2 [Rhododendron vialii]|uniref:LEAF RUST 10 DISEASE-RESISTANCE LOCUS RECEPTOR-LIKE PROTEIN KINASE-like 2.1 isoform X2 n=1 Tax=Rhododendron vialii TaxID=182163 RepID=UPI00265DD930|nr:LEAF RUST 10 DISEASE-RESISTANCE LOCUS RECEPTOR-LIKE PROTEIN KINASE-like 2.1 isoform X2 [Rhododendron vialii]
MKHQSPSPLTPSLPFTIFIIFITTTSISSGDSNYEACVPQNCGNQTIRYPFWIKNKQEPFCGFPGFELNCQNNNYPILQTPNNNFTIQEILYRGQTLRLSNTAVWNLKHDCWPPISNVSLEVDNFSVVSNGSDLYLLSNCSSLGENLLEYRIGCGEESRNGNGGLAMFGNDGNLGYGLRSCQTEVLAPVELVSGDVVRDYLSVLRRGFLVKWKAPDCTRCEDSGGRCGFDLVTFHFKCFCTDTVHSGRCSSGRKRLPLILGPAVPAVGIMVILLLCIFIKRNARSESIFFWKTQKENCRNIEAFLKNCGSLSPKRYAYSDIKKITNSFRTKLGQGGFGCVFKGKLENDCLVAVKVLKGLKGNGEDFINELATISRTSHVNIVTLLGFCFEGRHRALIYEFMPSGSLDKFIHDGGSLTYHQLGWDAMYRIAVGIARGLEYLHRGCKTRILHFDIKPHNILLDEDFCPKISDFGLAKLCPQKESIISLTGARGTVGYIAPEVFSRNFGGVSHKSDVYSYGMMVLEMVGGRKNISVEVDRTSEIYFPHWVYKRLELDEELGLHGIMDGEANASARKMIIVGLWCIQTDPSNRPSMSRVVEMLEGNTEYLQIPPKPYLSSPSRAPVDSSTTHVTTL